MREPTNRQTRLGIPLLLLAVAVVLAWAFWPGPCASGDTLVTTGGARYEGTATEVGDDYVLATPNGGKMTFPKSMVEKVIPGPIGTEPDAAPKPVPATASKPAAPEEAGSPATKSVASRPTDPNKAPAPDIDYSKVLYLIGPVPGLQVQQKDAESLNGISAGLSLVYTKAFKTDLPMFTLESTVKSGEAIKKEAIDRGIGFVLQVTIASFAVKDGKIDVHTMHQMLMRRGGKWETVFQGPVLADYTMSFVIKEKVRLGIPTLNPECSPAKLFWDFSAKALAVKLVKVNRLEAPENGGNRQVELVMKATSKLPYEVSRVSLVATAPNPAPQPKGALFSNDLVHGWGVAESIQPGQEQEFTVKMDAAEYQKAKWAFSLSYRGIG